MTSSDDALRAAVERVERALSRFEATRIADLDWPTKVSVDPADLRLILSALTAPPVTEEATCNDSLHVRLARRSTVGQSSTVRGAVQLAQFLEDCAQYFESRPTGGEDLAHWANTSNAENCRKAAALLSPKTARRVLAAAGGGK